MSAGGEALAFWLREPGRGEIRPAAVPAPGPGEVLVRTLRSGHQPRHRDAGLPRRRAAEPVRRDARAVPGGRLPGAGEVRLPQRRRRRAGARAARRPHGLLPAPAPDGLRRPGRRRSRWCPTACRPRGRCSPARVETAVNALWDAGPLVGDRVAVVGAGMVGCCVARLLAGIPGVEVTLVDVDPARRRRRRRPRRRLRRARATRPTGRDLVVHTSAHRRRAPALARPAARRGRPCSTSAGTATGPSRSRSAARSTPAG